MTTTIDTSLEQPLLLTANALLDVAGQRLCLDGQEEPLSPLRFESCAISWSGRGG